MSETILAFALDYRTRELNALSAQDKIRMIKGICVYTGVQGARVEAHLEPNLFKPPNSFSSGLIVINVMIDLVCKPDQRIDARKLLLKWMQDEAYNFDALS